MRPNETVIQATIDAETLAVAHRQENFIASAAEIAESACQMGLYSESKHHKLYLDQFKLVYNQTVKEL